MKFFDRENEISELRRIREASQGTARFTVLTGRRRVGKTELISQALGDQPFVYFYVSRKTQVNLCREFQGIVERCLGRLVPGRIERFSDLFRTACTRSMIVSSVFGSDSYSSMTT